MKTKMLLLLCMSACLSTHANNLVRVTSGSCTGHEGYIAASMTLNLQLETDELVNLLLDSIHPEYEITQQQEEEIKKTVEMYKRSNSPKLSFCFVNNKEHKCFGAFHVDSLEPIK